MALNGVLRCPQCGSEVMPLTVVGGKTTLAVEQPSGFTVYAYRARVRCWACKRDVHFRSVSVEGIAVAGKLA